MRPPVREADSRSDRRVISMAKMPSDNALRRSGGALWSLALCHVTLKAQATAQWATLPIAP